MRSGFRKAHYEALAEILRKVRANPNYDKRTVDAISRDMCGLFRVDNPDFDSIKWMARVRYADE